MEAELLPAPEVKTVTDVVAFRKKTLLILLAVIFVGIAITVTMGAKVSGKNHPQLWNLLNLSTVRQSEIKQSHHLLQVHLHLNTLML
jgi:hypothetical protein